MDRIVTVTVPAAGGSYDLTDLTTVKAEFLITGTDAARDTRLSRQISEESARIADYCNRVLIQETVSEVIRLDSLDRMLEAIPLSRRPIATIVSVTEDADAALDSAYYEIDAAAGLLYRLCEGYRTTWTACKVVVVYSGGYLFANVPKPLSAACLSLMRYRWAAGATAARDPAITSISVEGVGRKTFGGVGQQGDVGDLPADVAATLDRYRDVSP